jgi:hypothetical protein
VSFFAAGFFAGTPHLLHGVQGRKGSPDSPLVAKARTPNLGLLNYIRLA